MSLLDWGALCAALTTVPLHELSHAWVGKKLGARWHQLRWSWGIIRVVLNVTHVSPANQREIAAAGMLWDVSCFLAWSILWTIHPSYFLAGVGIWVSAAAFINLCPWIPKSDGWQVWRAHHSSLMT